ncbi:MAG: DUF1822 family protein, partial [Microcystaceae cyanobacterium]
MNVTSSLTFTVPLVQAARQLAEQFAKQQINPQKAQQVYLNTLAVYAVRFYLKCMGIETDWETSDSYNPVMQTLMDVADLEIPNLGKLECRPVLPENQSVYIPPEVWSDRIGYMAVKLDESLREAILLGFTQTASTEELPISQWQSLGDLLEHLHQLRQAELGKRQVNLSQWLENFFEAGWQSLESLLGTDQGSLALSFRGDSPLSESDVRRAKLIDLELQLGNQTVALLVALAQESEQLVGIQIQVHP